jgi:hypothetical protein
MPPVDHRYIHLYRAVSFDSVVYAAQSQGDYHLRKGVSGDWRNHFNDELAQEFIDKFFEECNGTDLDFSLGDNLRLTAQKKPSMKWKIRVEKSKTDIWLNDVIVSKRSNPSESYSFQTRFNRGVPSSSSIHPTRWEYLNSNVFYRSVTVFIHQFLNDQALFKS